MSYYREPTTAAVWKEINALTKLMVFYTVIIWSLAFLGFVLAFTVSPGAINMGLGCFLGGIPFTGITAAMIYIDGIGVFWK